MTCGLSSAISTFAPTISSRGERRRSRVAFTEGDAGRCGRQALYASYGGRGGCGAGQARTERLFVNK